jgi:rhodanese-related sulfurtransferase
MEYLGIALALLAIALALRGRNSSGDGEKLADLERDTRRRLENLAQELRGEQETNRRLLVELAAGRSLDSDQILEGRLWRDLDAKAAQQLMANANPHVLDVRTEQEIASGRLPGALHIPVQELEARVKELKQDGQPWLVYCAAGSRSAAACEFLSGQGFKGLYNLSGGISAWGGPVVRG